MTARLLHYAKEPVELDATVNYDPRGRVGKPNGLWVSVEGEDDWKSWCEDEEFRLGNLASVHEVTLTESARIARITNTEELRAFHEKWAEPTEWSRVIDGTNVIRPEVAGRDTHYWEPDWLKVSLEYDGIIIAPYIWCMRLDGPFWYYGWDCASGCIWNLEAVASFTLVEEGAEV